MLSKEARKVRRSNRTSYNVRKNNHAGLNMIIVNRTNANIRCQLVDIKGNTIITVDSANNAQKELVKKSGGQTYNIKGARIIGQQMGEKMKQIGCVKYVANRCSYQYHGRVAALFEGINEVLKGEVNEQ